MQRNKQARGDIALSKADLQMSKATHAYVREPHKKSIALLAATPLDWDAYCPHRSTPLALMGNSPPFGRGWPHTAPTCP